MKNIVLFSFLISILIWSCAKLTPKAPDAESVMNGPLAGLTAEQNKLFTEGAEEFDEVYTAERGLGPIYVAPSCAGCHSGDNKGHPFTILTRFGQKDTSGNTFLHLGGPQLQNRAIPGRLPEELPMGATSSKFLAPITAGVGFIDLIQDADLIAMSDPNDTNGDGVSGVPNWIKIPAWLSPSPGSITQNGKYIGKFGRKANAHNLHQQVVGAYNNDMGLTTSYLPTNPINYKDGLTVVPNSDVEISDKSLNANLFYLKVLQAPMQRNINNEEVKAGKELFIQIGCEACHKQTLKTGTSVIQQLSNKEFHPYSDFLLHDMGAELDDNYTEGNAATSEWRTTPLWGVGLSTDAQGGLLYLLHDGRAHSFNEAILLHGGEGSNSRAKFNALTEAQKNALIKFLNSL